MANQGEHLRTIVARLKRDCDELLRRIDLDGKATEWKGPSCDQLTEEQVLLIAKRAVDLFEKQPKRPPHVTMTQAAEMLGVSRRTISNMIASGRLRLNRCGRIPIEEVDKLLRSRS